jgi:hypothetical protein
MSQKPNVTDIGESSIERIPTYPLIDALLRRRSRRFGRGMKLNGGPLAYTSELPPQPLSIEQEAALAFAACGITGYALAELPYESGPVPEAGGGNIMKQFVGRTAPSADAAHLSTVFLIDDTGTYLLRRPQDFPTRDVPGLIQAAHEHKLNLLYERSRIRISDRRLDVERKLPFLPPFNKWSANVPGSTYFVPVSELTILYLNMLLSAFSGDFNYFVVDDRNGFRPAGIASFGRKRGGALYDDPRDGRLLTVSALEGWLLELSAIEVGGILQNLGLMTEALGIGGFPHFAAHPFAWQQVLGFRMEVPRLSRVIAAGIGMMVGMRLLGQDIEVPTAVGLEREGEVLIKPYCPPYYPTMKQAVHAFVDTKFGPQKGCFRDGGANTAWREPQKVKAEIPEYPASAVDATVAYCEYIHRRYGRFPAACGPFRTIMAYQAHQLDRNFYERFYRTGDPGCS